MNTTFELNCIRPHWSTDGRYFTAAHDRVTWQFEDGVTITAIERHDDRCLRYGRLEFCSTRRELDSKAKIYVSTSEPFNVVEDLTNRRRRPHNVWKPRVVEALARIGVEFDYIGWSQTAGCGCGCSPAFVPRDADALRRWDFWVELPNAPTIDDTKPARELAA